MVNLQNPTGGTDLISEITIIMVIRVVNTRRCGASSLFLPGWEKDESGRTGRTTAVSWDAMQNEKCLKNNL